MAIDIEFGPERPPQSDLPASLIFFVRKRQEEDTFIMSPDGWESNKQYEPILYTQPYEHYRKRRELENENPLVLDHVAVKGDRYEDVCNRVESREDFVGWARAPARS